LDFKGSHTTQRENHSSRGSLHSGTGGREESSKPVAWVEEARQEVQRQEASRTCETSMEDPFVSAGLTTMTEEASNQEY
jgi:hypothetical protein